MRSGNVLFSTEKVPLLLAFLFAFVIGLLAVYSEVVKTVIITNTTNMAADDLTITFNQFPRNPQSTNPKIANKFSGVMFDDNKTHQANFFDITRFNNDTSLKFKTRFPVNTPVKNNLHVEASAYFPGRSS